MNIKNLDLAHIAMLAGFTFATGFLDCLVNMNAPFSVPNLEHAGLAALLTTVAMARKSFIAPPAPPAPPEGQ